MARRSTLACARNTISQYCSFSLCQSNITFIYPLGSSISVKTSQWGWLAIVNSYWLEKLSATSAQS